MNELLKRYGEVQLVTLVDVPPEGGDWLHEIKFDGYRLLAFLEKAKIKLFTRKSNDWTARFPSIRDSVALLKVQSAILDMEAVIAEPSGRSGFHALQQALRDRGETIPLSDMFSISCISMAEIYATCLSLSVKRSWSDC